MVPDRLSRTSVKYYRYSLRNNPEEHSSDILRVGSMKSRTKRCVICSYNACHWKDNEFVTSFLLCELILLAPEFYI
jgi:hypothetical protein